MPDNAHMRRKLPHRTGLSRRELLFSLGLLAATPAAANVRDGGSKLECREAHYRVDATVLLWNVPVARRSGVGEAHVSLRQWREGDARRLELKFAAFSDPDRAQGVNRSGWIQESIEEHGPQPKRSTVLEFMSDSPEQSAAEARQARPDSRGGYWYVAIDSLNLPGRTRSRVANVRGKPGTSPLDNRMLELARLSFESTPPEWHETAWPATESGAAPATFLYSILRGLERNLPVLESGYVYNEDGYLLRLETKTETGTVRCVRGQVRCITKRKPASQFRLWMDGNATDSLPARIELMPKTFLKLTLQRIPPNTERIPKETQ